MQIEIIFGGNFSAAESMPDFLECMVSLFGVGSFFDQSEKKRIASSEVKECIMSKKKKWFSLSYLQGEVNLSFVSELNFFRLDVYDICDSLSFAERLVKSVLDCESFLQARVYDAAYDAIQNTKDVKYYEIRGLDTSELRKIKNGLPPPFDAEVIDISDNPGRWHLRKGYVESIGSTMWFSKVHLQYLKSQLSVSSHFDGIDIEDLGRTIKVVAKKDCFTKNFGEEAQQQNMLRRLIYNV